MGRYYCLFTNKDIYLWASFDTREKAAAAAAAAVQSNKAWKQFKREFGCYALKKGELPQEAARKIKEQKQIEKLKLQWTAALISYAVALCQIIEGRSHIYFVNKKNRGPVDQFVLDI